jgi:Fe-S-cluster containining protein
MRRMLRRQPNGDCVFLGAQGCVLTSASRPLVCRLYPHDYHEGGLDGIDDSYCPTAHLSPDGRPMTEVLDVSQEDAIHWHRMLYQELRDGTP